MAYNLRHMTEFSTADTPEREGSLAALHGALVAHTKVQQEGIFAGRPMHQAEITPLGAGHHNINSLVTVGDFSCVARTRPNKIGEPYNPIVNEFHKLASLGGSFCPAPFALSEMPCPTGGTIPVLYMEYVTGQPQDMRQLTSRQASRIAQTIGNLHSTPVSRLESLALPAPVNSEVYIRQEFQTAVFDRLAWIDLNDPTYSSALAYISTVHELFQRELEVQKEAFKYAQPRPLHRDLSKDNILWTPDDDCILIDWEGFCLGDPADDVSYFLIDNQIGERGQRNFLRFYQPPAGDITFHRRLLAYHLKNWADDMTWALAGYDRERKGKEIVCAERPGLFKTYFEDRLNRLGAFLRNLRYNEKQ